MKKKIMIIVFAWILYEIIIFFSNPLTRPEERIKENILKNTPVGLSLGEVCEVITNEGWDDVVFVENSGYELHPNDSIDGKVHFVGEKYIRATLGRYKYHLLFDAYVCVFWGFDETDKLIDLYVSKYIDAF